MSAHITLTGRVGTDPELRYTAAGNAVCAFMLVTKRRVKQGEEWVDADVTWWRVSCWDRLGERVADAISKRDDVIVTGQAIERTWEHNDERRSRIEIRADGVGINLRWSNTTTRAPTTGPEHDPWATPATSPADGDDEPPF